MKRQKPITINKEEFLKEETSKPYRPKYNGLMDPNANSDKEPQDRNYREASPVETQLIAVEKNLLDLENKLETLSQRLIPISKDIAANEVDEGIDKAEENLVKRIQKINLHINSLIGNLGIIMENLEI